MSLDAIRLDILKSLLDAASPGPWEAEAMPYNLRDGHPEVRCVVVGDEGVTGAIYLVAPDTTAASKADAALVVALRNAAPALIAEVERLRGVLGRIACGMHGRELNGDTSGETDWQIARAALKGDA